MGAAGAGLQVVWCAVFSELPRGWQGSRDPWELPEASWDTGIHQSIPFAVSSNRLCQKQPVKFFSLKSTLRGLRPVILIPAAALAEQTFLKTTTQLISVACAKAHIQTGYFISTYSLFLLLLASILLPVFQAAAYAVVSFHLQKEQLPSSAVSGVHHPRTLCTELPFSEAFS